MWRKGWRPEQARADCPFRGQVEIDESTFGPTCQRGRPGRGRGRGGLIEAGFKRHRRIDFNNRKSGLCKILLKSCRMKPFRR